MRGHSGSFFSNKLYTSRFTNIHLDLLLSKQYCPYSVPDPLEKKKNKMIRFLMIVDEQHLAILDGEGDKK